MNLALKNKITVLLGNSDATKSVLEMLEAPDKQFDEVYPMLQKALDDAFDNPAVQADMLYQLRSIEGDFDKAEFNRTIEQLKDEINDDSSLSKNKKKLLCSLFVKSGQTSVELKENPRERVKVKVVKLNPDAIIPTYAHPTDCGADVAAVEEITIESGETKIIPTGLAVAIPAGYEIQIRPRSGLSLKTGLRIANGVGTIDAEYRGEIGVIITNTGNVPYTITKGMKIAQMAIAPTPMIIWDETEALDETERGNGGFGSTDKS